MQFSGAAVTISLIRRRPATAARVLASLEPADAAVFLADIPTRFAATAFTAITPWSAARILRHMARTAGGSLIRELEFAAATRVLRLLSPAERAPLLEALPRSLRRSFDLSLQFPADTVGACMTMDIATLMTTDTPAAALNQVKRAPRHTMELLFVTDSQHHYRGVLHAVDLLRHPEFFGLADLMDSSCPALPAQATLERMAELDAWNRYSHLPVVSRSGELLGALPRAALSRAAADAGASGRSPSIADSLVGAMSASLSGLLALLAEPAKREDRYGR